MRYETLDDTIDRVASELTVVSSDDALADRVRERITQPRRLPFVGALAAATVAGVVVLALVLRPTSPDVTTRAAGELPAHRVAPLAPLAAGQQPYALAPRVELTRITERRALPPPEAGAGADNVAPGLEMHLQSAPAPLAIAEIDIPPVVRPAGVDIAALEIAPIEVPGLVIASEQKEQK